MRHLIGAFMFNADFRTLRQKKYLTGFYCMLNCSTLREDFFFKFSFEVSENHHLQIISKNTLF
jgi:hypothetical protein